MSSPQWFENWFNSPYYHLLYNNRNHEEASYFINNLFRYFHFKPQDKVWDLACGQGRHALALHRLGLDVTGSDLSENNILEAKKAEEPGLEFLVHDMRHSFRKNYYNAVLNLFTSLGYFSEYNDNQKVFQNADEALKSGGFFLIDFFNAKKVSKHFKDRYEEKRGEVCFQISKKISDKRVIKHIEFNCGKKEYYFEELVSLLELKDFESFSRNTNLKLQDVFGNYSLEPFSENVSDRLIMVFKKAEA